MITIEEYYLIVHRRKNDYIRMGLKSFRNKVYAIIPQDVIDSLYNDLILKTAEKLIVNKIKFESEDNVEDYMIKGFFYSIKDNFKSQHSKKTLYHFNYDTGETETEVVWNRRLNYDMLTSELYTDSTTEEEIEEVNTEHIYHKIFSYVYDNYSFRDASVYKKKIIDNLTYDELSKETGFDRNLLWKIVYPIQEDIKLNKHTILNSKYNVPNNIYSCTDEAITVADAINLESKEQSSVIRDTVYSLANNKKKLLKLLEMSLPKFIETYI